MPIGAQMRRRKIIKYDLQLGTVRPIDQIGPGR